jgi:hypothetical protein
MMSLRGSMHGLSFAGILQSLKLKIALSGWLRGRDGCAAEVIHVRLPLIWLDSSFGRGVVTMPAWPRSIVRWPAFPQK